MEPLELTAVEHRSVRPALAVQARSVLFITYDFPPSLEMGAHASAQVARYLPLFGWEPVVLTVLERHATNPDPGGRSLDAASRVVRTGLIPHPLTLWAAARSRLRAASTRAPAGDDGHVGIGRLRRWVLALLKTPDANTGWIVPATLTGYRQIRATGARALLSSGPCWSNHLVGVALQRLTRLPW